MALKKFLFLRPNKITRLVNMKKTLSIFALIAISICANAQQQVKIGPKAGVNFSTLSNLSKTKTLTGFYVGAVAELKLTEQFSFQPELLYSSQGAKNVYSETLSGNEVQHHNHDILSYINIPVMGKYFIVNSFSIELGPQFGLLIKAENKDKITTNGVEVKENRDFKDEVNSFDFGIGAGLAYELPSGLFANARYNYGLTNVGKSGQYYGGSKNRVMQLGIGFKF